MSTEDLYEPKDFHVGTGNYIRCVSSSLQGSWILSKNSVEGGIQLTFTGQDHTAIKGLTQWDVACIQKVCELYMNEVRKDTSGVKDVKD